MREPVGKQDTLLNRAITATELYNTGSQAHVEARMTRVTAYLGLDLCVWLKRFEMTHYPSFLVITYLGEEHSTLWGII